MKDNTMFEIFKFSLFGYTITVSSETKTNRLIIDWVNTFIPKTDLNYNFHTKIQRIKRVREISSLGLAEAKEFVEAHWQ